MLVPPRLERPGRLNVDKPLAIRDGLVDHGPIRLERSDPDTQPLPVTWFHRTGYVYGFDRCPGWSETLEGTRAVMPRV